MAVVTMFQKGVRPQQSIPLPLRTRRLLWTVAVLDAMTASWMVSAGDWLNDYSRVTAVATLGGNHKIVLALAVLGFVVLAGVATMTGGFQSASRPQLVAIAVAGAVSVVAVAGGLSVIALVLLSTLAGRAFLR